MIIVLRGHGDRTKAVSLWGVRKVDVQLDRKGSGDLCQVREGEGIPGKENSVGEGPPFEWEAAS